MQKAEGRAGDVDSSFIDECLLRARNTSIEIEHLQEQVQFYLETKRRLDYYNVLEVNYNNEAFRKFLYEVTLDVNHLYIPIRNWMKQQKVNIDQVDRWTLLEVYRNLQPDLPLIFADQVPLGKLENKYEVKHSEPGIYDILNLLDTTPFLSSTKHAPWEEVEHTNLYLFFKEIIQTAHALGECFTCVLRRRLNQFSGHQNTGTCFKTNMKFILDKFITKKINCTCKKCQSSWENYKKELKGNVQTVQQYPFQDEIRYEQNLFFPKEKNVILKPNIEEMREQGFKPDDYITLTRPKRTTPSASTSTSTLTLIPNQTPPSTPDVSTPGTPVGSNKQLEFQTIEPSHIQRPHTPTPMSTFGKSSPKVTRKPRLHEYCYTYDILNTESSLKVKHSQYNAQVNETTFKFPAYSSTIKQCPLALNHNADVVYICPEGFHHVLMRCTRCKNIYKGSHQAQYNCWRCKYQELEYLKITMDNFLEILTFLKTYHVYDPRYIHVIDKDRVREVWIFHKTTKPAQSSEMYSFLRTNIGRIHSDNMKVLRIDCRPKNRNNLIILFLNDVVPISKTHHFMWRSMEAYKNFHQLVAKQQSNYIQTPECVPQEALDKSLRHLPMNSATSDHGISAETYINRIERQVSDYVGACTKLKTLQTVAESVQNLAFSTPPQNEEWKTQLKSAILTECDAKTPPPPPPPAPSPNPSNMSIDQLMDEVQEMINKDQDVGQEEILQVDGANDEMIIDTSSQPEYVQSNQPTKRRSCEYIAEYFQTPEPPMKRTTQNNTQNTERYDSVDGIGNLVINLDSEISQPNQTNTNMNFIQPEMTYNMQPTISCYDSRLPKVNMKNRIRELRQRYNSSQETQGLNKNPGPWNIKIEPACIAFKANNNFKFLPCDYPLINMDIGEPNTGPLLLINSRLVNKCDKCGQLTCQETRQHNICWNGACNTTDSLSPFRFGGTLSATRVHQWINEMGLHEIHERRGFKLINITLDRQHVFAYNLITFHSDKDVNCKFNHVVKPVPIWNLNDEHQEFLSQFGIEQDLTIPVSEIPKKQIICAKCTSCRIYLINANNAICLNCYSTDVTPIRKGMILNHYAENLYLNKGIHPTREAYNKIRYFKLDGTEMAITADQWKICTERLEMDFVAKGQLQFIDKGHIEGTLGMYFLPVKNPLTMKGLIYEHIPIMEKPFLLIDNRLQVYCTCTDKKCTSYVDGCCPVTLGTFTAAMVIIDAIKQQYPNTIHETRSSRAEGKSKVDHHISNLNKYFHRVHATNYFEKVESTGRYQLRFINCRILNSREQKYGHNSVKYQDDHYLIEARDLNSSFHKEIKEMIRTKQPKKRTETPPVPFRGGYRLYCTKCNCAKIYRLDFYCYICALCLRHSNIQAYCYNVEYHINGSLSLADLTHNQETRIEFPSEGKFICRIIPPNKTVTYEILDQRPKQLPKPPQMLNMPVRNPLWDQYQNIPYIPGQNLMLPNPEQPTPSTSQGQPSDSYHMPSFAMGI